MFYITPFFWFILLLSTPVITMRLFALEKFSGTFETLMTAPVSDLQVVLAKFTAACIFYTLMWLPLIGCLFVIRHYTSDPMSFDASTLASTFAGILLLGCLFLSAGLLRFRLDAQPGHRRHDQPPVWSEPVSGRRNGRPDPFPGGWQAKSWHR